MDKASGGASGQSWMSKLGDDRGNRGSRTTEVKGEAGYPDPWAASTTKSDPWAASAAKLDPWAASAVKVASATSPDQPRPKTDWREALSDDRGSLRDRGSSGPSGGAVALQSKKEERPAGDWSSRLADDRHGSRSSRATAAQATPSSPASGGADRGAQRMLGLAMRSAGGDMRTHGAGSSRASATNGAHGTDAPKKDSGGAEFDTKAKLKSFLLSKRGQFEQRKRTLRACVQQGGNILGEGVTLESDLVEEAIREAEAEVASEWAAPTPGASQAEASPEVETQDDWWSNDQKWEDNSKKWEEDNWTDKQWESQNGDTWRSNADWKSDDKRWEGGDKWWEGGQNDSTEHKWSNQEATEQGEQQEKHEGSGWASAGADTFASGDVSEDDMVNRLLTYLKNAKDPAKAMAVIRKSDDVSSRVAEAAIAMYEGKDRNSALGGGIYQ